MGHWRSVREVSLHTPYPAGFPLPGRVGSLYSLTVALFFKDFLTLSSGLKFDRLVQWSGASMAVVHVEHLQYSFSVASLLDPDLLFQTLMMDGQSDVCK